MKIRVVKLGRAAYPELRTMAGMYEERLRAFARVEGVEEKEGPATDRLVKDLAAAGSGQLVVALDERGREWTSVEFADRLRSWRDDPAVKDLHFVVGGPMGLPPELRRRADLTLGLSRATMTSDLAWLILWEQLYRGFNILAGTAYHHA